MLPLATLRQLAAADPYYKVTIRRLSDMPYEVEDAVSYIIEDVDAGRERPEDWELVTEVHPPEPKVNGGTLAELMGEELEPIRFVVEGLVPEGLTILAGKPKLGKSWLALSMSLAICAGHDTLELPTVAGETLYVSLEDGKRRIQNRVMTLGGHHLGTALDRFHYRTQWPALNNGGVGQFETWMADHPDTRLIVIDTYGRMRGDLPGKDRFAEEYNQLGTLQSFATKHRIAIILVHHLRKQAADDWLEQLSGTQAVTATADTLLGLFRERGQMDATLRLVSREVDEKDLALKFDGGRWTSMGDAAAYRTTVERSDIIDVLRQLGEAKTSEIAALIDKTVPNTSYLLGKLCEEGLVRKVRYGVYALEALEVNETDDPLTHPQKVLELDPATSSTSSSSRGGVKGREGLVTCLLCSISGGHSDGCPIKLGLIGEDSS